MEAKAGDSLEETVHQVKDAGATLYATCSKGTCQQSDGLGAPSEMEVTIFWSSLPTYTGMANSFYLLQSDVKARQPCKSKLQKILSLLVSFTAMTPGAYNQLHNYLCST